MKIWKCENNFFHIDLYGSKIPKYNHEKAAYQQTHKGKTTEMYPFDQGFIEETE